MEIQEIINSLNFSNIIWQIITPLIFSGIDIVTGYIQAIINNNIDSKVMRTGLLHKVVIILIILSSFIFDKAFSLPVVSKVICIYVIIMEVVSILENIQKAGINLGKLGNLLKVKGDETDEIK